MTLKTIPYCKLCKSLAEPKCICGALAIKHLKISSKSFAIFSDNLKNVQLITAFIDEGGNIRHIKHKRDIVRAKISEIILKEA